MNILIIGGAGFIGSHLVDRLLDNHTIYVYDNLDPQVHDGKPDYLNKHAVFIQGDIRDRKRLKYVICHNNIDVIYHLAAKVGVGQSMYEIEEYVDVNERGTATLLDILVNEQHNVRKLIVASSMSTYGEGMYVCETCGKVNPSLRSKQQLKDKKWELECSVCGSKLKPIPTDETTEQNCTSIYALTKKEQEKMCMLIGDTYDIHTTALRFFNVYGSRQALSNPYTGVCAIFSSNLLCENSPTVYEDGNQTRDFVHVDDICQALELCLKPEANGEIFNVGTGKPITIKKIAQTLTKKINSSITPEITNEFRPGDIRHCYSDITKIQTILGYEPKYTFESGISELIEWVKLQTDVQDRTKKANNELREKSLLF